MVGDFQLLNKILRFSIINILLVPIYIFATESKRSQPELLAIAILSIFVVFTTYFWWERVQNKPNIWKYLDRGTAASIAILTLYYGNNTARGFVALGILFFFMGMTDTFKESDSYLNHIAFRYFVGLGIIIYVTDQPYEKIFVGVSTLFLLFGLYQAVKGITYSCRESIVF